MFFRAPLVFLLGLASASAFLLPTPAARPSTQVSGTPRRDLQAVCVLDSLRGLL